jgi:rhamnosyltransferase
MFVEALNGLEVRGAEAMSDPKVVAVIVAYHPNLAVIESTATMVSKIVVVNNDRGDWPAGLKASVLVHTPGRNIGLAAAYNFGAQFARKEGATHLLLLDQDSVPAPGMVPQLLAQYSRGELVGGVGPLWKDPRTGEAGGFAVEFGSKRIPGPDEVLNVEFLISSGSLIGLAAISELGPFDDRLFIEHVDTDWALRAKANGFALYGVGAAVLEHTIGEAVLVLPGTGRRAFVYPPERTYYLVRNSIRLWLRPYATWRWRLFDCWRLCRLLLLYLVFVPDGGSRFKSILQGVRDAFRPEIAERPR